MTDELVLGPPINATEVREREAEAMERFPELDLTAALEKLAEALRQIAPTVAALLKKKK